MKPSFNGDWLQLASGDAFTMSGRILPLDIRDVAHALSNTCRFAGASKRFYSVAQHSVLVSNIVLANPKSDARDHVWALIHDATEMVIGDIPRPTKQMLPTIKAFEALMMERILIGLGISHKIGAMSDRVKHADNVALATEKQDVMAKPIYDWVELPAPWLTEVVPVQPAVAKAQFLAAWEFAIGRLATERRETVVMRSEGEHMTTSAARFTPLGDVVQF